MYPICNPYSGRMGPEWESIFEPAFRGGLGSHKDDYDNLQRHLKGTDIGGIPPSTAAQVAANAEHLNAFTAHDSGPNTADGRKSRRQFGQRSTDVITYLRSHCPVKRIELRIDELVQLYETGLGTPGAPLLTFQRNAALQLCYPAGHPNAGAQITLEQKRDLQAFGNSLARHVFGIVRREFGVHKQSALLTLTNEGTWQSISLESVGYHDDSLADLKCLMDDSNRRFGNVYNAEACRIKFLSVVELARVPATVSTRVTNELLNASAECRDAAGAPSYELTVSALSTLWKHEMKKGNISRKERPQSTAGTLFSLEETDEPEEGDGDAYAFSEIGSQSSTITGMRHCWKCNGFDHEKRVCPSPEVTPKRSIKDSIAGLTEILNRNRRLGFQGGGRGRGGYARGGRTGGRGRGPRPLTGSRMRPPQPDGSAMVLQPPQSEQSGEREYDESEASFAHVDMAPDGSVYDHDGNFLGSVVPAEDTLQSEQSNVLGVETGAAGREQDLHSPDASETPGEAPEPPAFEFKSTVYDGNYLEGPGAGDKREPFKYLHDDEGVQEGPEQLEEPEQPEAAGEEVERGISMSIALAIAAGALAVGVAAGRVLGARGGRGLFTALLLGSASALTAPRVGTRTYVMPKLFDGSVDCFLLPGKAPLDAEGAVVDTGTTRCASGRLKNFPRSLISEWHPMMRVRSAERRYMSVDFLGTMVIKPKNAPKKHRIAVEGSMYVPKMGELTLLSPRQLFKQNGIKSHFNDVCALEFPDGELVCSCSSPRRTATTFCTRRTRGSRS